MKISIVDNGSELLADLRRLCQRYGEVATVAPGQIGTLSTDLTVLSGGRIHAAKGAGDSYHREAVFVREHAGPVIGVCAGMQLIAASFAQPLGRLERRVGGERPIELLDGKLRMALGGGIVARVAERHGWSVPAVGSPLRALARSKDGVEVLAHITKPIVGLQFHPEIGAGDGARIFEWAIEKVTVGHRHAPDMVYSPQ